MKNKQLRILSLALSLSMVLFFTSCGNDLPATSSDYDSESKTEVSEPTTHTEKVQITDFYQYANEDWLSSQKYTEGKTTLYQSDSAYEKCMQQLKAWMISDSSLFTDSGMKNVVTIGNQLANREKYKDLCATSRQIDLDRIDQISSLEELYELYADKNFSAYNFVWWHYAEDFDGEYLPVVEPRPLFYAFPDPSVNEIANALVPILEAAGYDVETAALVAKNAAEIDCQIIDYFHQTEDSAYQCWTPYYAKDMGLLPPVNDTMIALDAVTWDKAFYAPDSFGDFINSLYTEKNLSKLKDHMKTCLILQMAPYSEDDTYYQYIGEKRYLSGGFDKDTMYVSQEELNFRIFSSFGNGTLARYYVESTVGQNKIDDIEQMTDDLIVTIREMLGNTPWLTTHGKELAKRKVHYIKTLIASDGTHDLYDNLQLTDNPYENGKLLLMAERNFNLQNTDEKNRPVYSPRDALDMNSYYYSYLNTILLCGPYLAQIQDMDDTSYEAVLGFLGETIAHELSHAYDFSGSQYDETGAYNPWMTEEEFEEYNKIRDKIITFFDGRDTALGNTINGELIADETFADLMAMETCLHLLSKQENPNYEAFFTAYAKDYAVIETPEVQDNNMKTDGHLPGRERVNWVLAQFDIFYDTFDVSEDSPYYLPKEDRIWENFSETS